jgi:uncharacterized damage-inducible protein DinB
MTLIDRYLAELDREAARTRKVLAQVPTGHDDFKPHEKSMPFGRLAGLVASMFSWVTLVLDQDELDLTPPPGQGQYQPPKTEALVAVMDDHATKARASLNKVTDEYLDTTRWRLKAQGQVVMNELRYVVLRETFNHLAHHRGQLTVYLRLLNQKVPAVYGPSADDQQFA